MPESSAVIGLALIFAKGGDFPDLMDRALASLGEDLGLSRSYLYEDSLDGATAHLTHKWRRPGAGAGERQVLPYADTPSLTIMSGGRRFLALEGPKAFPEDLRQALGIAAPVPAILAPLRIGGRNPGFLGLEYQGRSSAWTDQELEDLATIMDMVSTAYSRDLLAGQPGSPEGNYRDFLKSLRQEKDLGRERRRLIDVVDGTRLGIWEWNVQTGETFFNAFWAEILGYGPRDLEPSSIDTWLRLTHPEDLAESQRRLDLHFSGQTEYYECECRMRRKDGTWAWILDRGRIVERDGDGRPLRMCGTHTDITELKSVSTALRSSEANFRDFFETLGEMAAVASPHGGILHANAALGRALGYGPGDYATMSLLALFRAEDRPKAQACMEALLSGNAESCGLSLATKAGSPVPAESRAWEGQWDGQGCVFWVSRNLSAEKKAQGRFELLFRRNPALLALTSLSDGRFIDVNDAFLRHLGYSREEIVGKTPAELDIYLLSRLRSSIIQKLRAEGSISDINLQLRRKDGSILDGVFSGEFVENQGDIHMLGAVIDVSEARRAEAALVETNRRLEDALGRADSASQAKSGFLATMSHEIRTPMNAILGAAGLLATSGLDPDQEQYTRIIRSSGDALLGLINGILDFPKIEAGRLELEELDFDLEVCLEDCVKILGGKAREKGLSPMSTIGSGVPRSLRGDPGRLRQVLINIAGNAVKFTRQGEVRIHTTLIEEFRDRVLLRFEVRDTGVGIAPAKNSGLFVSFSQGDSSTTREFGGSGLGLAISRSLVRLMGGDIGFESEEGRGSTFWFTISLGKRPSGLVCPGEGPPDLAGLRALVAKADEGTGLMLSSILSRWGGRCEIAGEGQDASDLLKLALAEGDPYSVAFVCFGPEGDGWEAAIRDIRALSARGGTRLVMLAAPGSAGASVRLVPLGFSGFLSLPVGEAKLRECLSQLLRPLEGPGPFTSLGGPLSPARILLAEDNSTNQFVTLKILESLGYGADVAADGREALVAVSSSSYDLVLMDCQMPEMDGLEATRRIRGTEAEGHHLAIVAMTANAIQGDRERCVAAGMDDYLSKPVDPARLRATLERWLPKGQAVMPEADPPGTAPSTAEVPSEKWPVFDRKALLERTMGKPGLARSLREIFLKDISIQLEGLALSLSLGDLSKVIASAHRIKGAAANMGGLAAAEVAARMEAAGRAGDSSVLAVAMAELRTRLAELQEALEKEL